MTMNEQDDRAASVQRKVEDYHAAVADLEAADIAATKARGQWRHAVLEMAAELAAAKADHANVAAFSQWLDEHRIDLSHQDRAAVINMGEHLDVTARVLETTQRRSLRLIWTQEIAGQVTSVGNLAPDPPSPTLHHTESAETGPATSAPAPVPPPVIDLDGARLRTRADMDVIMGGEVSPDDRQKIHAHLLNAKTRAGLGRLGRNMRGPIERLILLAIDRNLFGPPVRFQVLTPTLRLVLPWAPELAAGRYNLRSYQDRAFVTEALDILAEHRDWVGQASAWRDVERLVLARRTPPPPEPPKRIRPLDLPTDAIICYGTSVWPVPEGQTAFWDRQTMCEAIWFFQFLIRQMDPASSPRAKERQTYPILKWIPPRDDTPWKRAVRAVATAYGANPDGPCHVPPPEPD